MGLGDIFRLSFWSKARPACTSAGMTVPPWAARNSSYPLPGRSADVESSLQRSYATTGRISGLGLSTYSNASTVSGPTDNALPSVLTGAPRKQRHLQLVKSEKIPTPQK